MPSQSGRDIPSPLAGKMFRLVYAALAAVLLLTLAAGPAHAQQTQNLISNGSFEDGAAGWEYEQWLKEKPLPGVVDKEDHPAGYSASFKMGLAGTTGPRDFYHFARNLKRRGQAYLLTFWLKPTNMPANSAHVRISRGYGGAMRSEAGELDWLTTGATQDWKQYTLPIPPAPDGAMGELIVHFVHDQMGQGTLGIAGVSLRLATPEEIEKLADGGKPASTPAGPNLIANGSFENDMAGWGYEQWSNRPVPGTVDKQDHAPGFTASFKMGLAGETGGRWIAYEVPLAEPAKSYLLSFYLKTQDLPGGAAYVRLGREGLGWLGSEEGRSDIMKLGGTHDWRHFRVPIHAKESGDSKKLNLFFYNDKMSQGVLGICGVALRVATEEELKNVRRPALEPDSFEQLLTADTNRPDDSTFAVGEKVELNFQLVGGSARAKAPLKLSLEVLDEHDQRIETKELPVTVDADGEWQATVQAPTPRLGFYRVKAKLSDGTLVAPLGTRPSGFLTYVIVPDPARRVDYGEAQSHFAMQGAWNVDICSRLGVRWTLDDSLQWGRTEPNRAGEFGPEQIKKFATEGKPGSATFRVGALPTLYKFAPWATIPSTSIYMTGTLTPEGEKAWASYCTAAAQAFSAKYAQSKLHVYQITWEPIYPWGFKGTNADLVRIYEIAYKALHQADPYAIVAGPCRGLYSNGDPDDTVRLLKAGLNKCLDGYAVHAYHSATPEKDGMPQDIRRMKEILRSETGKDIPMYGTEQGLATDEDVSKEIEVARSLMRQNLITLGEGFAFNFAFTLYDYRMAGSRTGYGYYYNLVPGVPFGPSKMCPKAIAAAYAAQSMLLEGTKSVGAIEWLGNTIWGYAFERSDATILALWNYGSEAREVSIPLGVAEARVFDWMGNERVAKTSGGVLTLKLGPEPVYISGVSPMLWGSEAAKLLSVDAKSLQAYPGARVLVRGKAMKPDKSAASVTLQLEDPSGALQPASQALTADSTAPFQFDVQTPSTLRPGTRTLHLRLRNAGGETITATTLNLEIVSPVTVTSDVAFTAEGKPALAIALQEKQGKAAAGQLDVSLKELIPGADRGDAPMIDLVVDPGKARDVPGAARQVSFDLPANGSKRLLIDFADAPIAPAKRYQSLIATTLAGGTAFSQTAPVHFLGASHVKQAPTIDGDLSEWQSTVPVTLTGPQDVVRSPQYYPQGLSARLRYLWDEKALYLSADVDDDVFVQNHTGDQTWSQDCLQLAFNLDGKPSAQAASTGERRTCEINVALTRTGPQAFRSLSYSAEKLPLGLLNAQQFTLAIKRAEPKVLRYEMAIPWATLGLPAGQSPRPGDAIGVAVTVNDVHSPTQGDPCALGLFGGITDKDANKNGILTLKGD